MRVVAIGGSPAPAGPGSRVWSRTLHANFVGGLVVLPGDRTIVSSSEDGAIVVADAATGEERRRIESHEMPVNHLALSPDGTRLVTASDDRTVRVYDTVDFRELVVCEGHEDYVSRVAVTAHGKIVSAGKDTTARVWDLATGKELAVYRGHAQWILGLTLVPGLPEALTSSMDGALKRWNVDLAEETGAPIEGMEPGTVLMVPGYDLFLGRHNKSGVGHEEFANDLVVTPDGKWLVSVEKKILVHDLATGAQRAAHGGHAWTMKKVVLSADAQRVFTAGDDVRAWRFDDGRELALFPGESSEYYSLALSHDGRRLFAGTKEGAICCWDVEAGLAAGAPRGHTKQVTRVVFSADGSLLASAAQDGRVGIWKTEIGEPMRLHPRESPFTSLLHFTRDGRRLVAGTQDGEMTAFDLASGERVDEGKRDGDWINAFAPTLDGKHLVVGSVGEKLVRWSLDSLATTDELRGDAKHVGAVEVTADGSRAVTICYDNEKPAPLQVWDLARLELVASYAPEHGYYSHLVLLEGGARAAAATSGGTIDVWDLARGTKLASFQAHPGYLQDLFRLPNGDLLTISFERAGSERNPPPAPLMAKRWHEDGTPLGRVRSDRLFPHVRELLLDADGRAAWVLAEDALLRWNLETGAMEAAGALDDATSLAVHGDRLAIGHRDGRLLFLRASA